MYKRTLLQLITILMMNISLADWYGIDPETGLPTKFDQEEFINIEMLANLHLDNLISKGIKDIGELNLPALKENIKMVDWSIWAHDNFPVASGGKRDSGLYYVFSRQAYISQDTLLDFSGTGYDKATLLLHEALGSLGYIDDNYQYSSAIVYLSSREENELEEEVNKFSPIFEKVKRRKKDKEYKDEGGVTVIGGGGQIEMAGLKSYLYFKASQSEFLYTGITSEEAKIILAEIPHTIVEMPKNSSLFKDYKTYIKKGPNTYVINASFMKLGSASLKDKYDFLSRVIIFDIIKSLGL